MSIETRTTISSSTWQFSCAAGPYGDLCLNGGVCVNGTSCVCPAGFMNDNDWFHFPNCTRSGDSGKIMFIIFALGYALSLIFYVVRVRPWLRKDLVPLGWLTATYFVALWVFVLGLYVEDGCYTVCAVFSNSAFILVDWMCCKVVLLVMNPLYAMRKRPFGTFKNGMLIWTSLTSFGCLVFGIAMAVLNTHVEGNALAYNVAAFLSSAILWVGGIVQVGAVLVASTKLQSELVKATATSSGRSAEEGLKTAQTTKRLVRRLQYLQMGAIVILAPFIILLVGIPIVLTMLGSVPYFYVIVYLELVTSFLYGLAFLFFLKNPPAVESGTHQESAGGAIAARAAGSTAIVGVESTSHHVVVSPAL